MESLAVTLAAILGVGGFAAIYNAWARRDRSASAVALQTAVTDKALELLDAVESHWMQRAMDAEAKCEELESECARLQAQAIEEGWG